MKRNEDTPLPQGWNEELLNRADLDGSFRALESCPHFHASTMRGRIRTLQIRISDAWKHFEQAEAVRRNAVEGISDLYLGFLLQVYRFENALLEQGEPDEPKLSEPKVPVFSEVFLDEFPNLRPLLRIRRRVQGQYLLSSGRSSEAFRVFKKLAEDKRADNETLAHSYLSLACCHFNLDSEDDGYRFLESSELAIHACDAVLHRGYLCGLLYALYMFKDDTQKASEWKEFLYSLPCPEPTKAVLFQRGEWLVTRCRQQNHLLVF